MSHTYAKVAQSELDEESKLQVKKQSSIITTTITSTTRRRGFGLLFLVGALALLVALVLRAQDANDAVSKERENIEDGSISDEVEEIDGTETGVDKRHEDDEESTDGDDKKKEVIEKPVQTNPEPTESTSDEESTETIPEEANGPTITLLTGTHLDLSRAKLQSQSDLCVKLSQSLFEFWTSEKIANYTLFESHVEKFLFQIGRDRVSCFVTGTTSHLLTFPITMRDTETCGGRWKETMELHGKEEKVLQFDVFLYRPDLLSLQRMLKKYSIEMKTVLVLGRHPDDATFHRERCGFYNNLLEQYSTYKYTLLWNNLSDLQTQLRRMVKSDPSTEYSTLICDREGTNPLVSIENIEKWTGVKAEQVQDTFCFKTTTSSSSPTQQQQDLSSLFIPNQMPILNQMQPPSSIIKKTKSTGVKILFLAGLEGVGHHAFSSLREGHFLESLQAPMRGFLGMSAYPTDKTYVSAKNDLIKAFKELTTKASHGVYFLYSYSYPFGGPYCVFRKIGRSLCNPNLVELVQIAEEAQIDLRIFILERGFEAALASSTLHRHFDDVYLQAKLMLLASSVLQVQTGMIDPKFVARVRYEKLDASPTAFVKDVVAHLGLDTSSPIYTEFVRKLLQASRKPHSSSSSSSSISASSSSNATSTAGIGMFPKHYQAYVKTVSEQFGQK